MDINPSIMAMFIPIVAIVGGITVVIVSTVMKSRLRELEIKERIAMIERGMVPAPEADPRGFDHAITRLEQVQRIRDLQGNSGYRHRRAGVTLMGVGFGLMVLLGFTAEDPWTGVGVGGFLVIMGLAFFVNALFDRRHVPPPSSPTVPPPAPNPPPRQE